MKKIMTAVVVSAILTAPVIFAAGVPAGDLMIKEMRAKDVRYVTGGVGSGERQAMEKMAESFNLKIVFADMGGSYLARVPFVIAKPVGETVLAETANGPWLLVDLPPGAYTVTAEHEGTRRVQTVQVGSGLSICMFHWKT